jgi:GntR family transcriptional regulator, rspAB operon transcriptional repressor
MRSTEPAPPHSLQGLDLGLAEIRGLPSRIYSVLKARILTCAFLPGSRLMEKDLSEAMGVSRTPIREALNRLALERLVELTPYRGYAVAPVRPDDMRNLCELRSIVESEAAALAAERATAGEVEELVALATLRYVPGDPATYQNYLRDNSTFHLALARTTRNERLEATVATVLEQIQRPMYLALDVGLDSESATAEHLLIVEAIRDRDPERARRLMREQLVSTEGRIGTVLAPAQQ